MQCRKARDERQHVQVVPFDTLLILDLTHSGGDVRLYISVKICPHVPTLPSCFEDFPICKEVEIVQSAF